MRGRIARARVAYSRLLHDLRAMLASRSVILAVEDKRSEGAAVDARLTGTLRAEQVKSIDTLKGTDTGVGI